MSVLLLDGRSDLRRKRTVERNIRSIYLRALLIRFFRRLLKFFQLLFFLFLLAHVIRSLSFKIWLDDSHIHLAIKTAKSYRGIGRFFGKGMCPVTVGSSAEASAFGSCFRMARAACR